MSGEQVLVPSSITISVDKKSLKIADAQFSFSFNNNSKLHRSVIGNKGIEGYALQKGNTIEVTDEIELIIVVDPNGESESTIKRLRKDMKPRSSEASKAYDQDILIHIEGPGQEKICNISFQGFIVSLSDDVDSNSNLRRYRVVFKIANSDTFKIS